MTTFSNMLTILFDGIAYGMLLFILAVGLAVTMGLMNFINLAHGAFAMAGGYITVLLMQRLDVPFLVCLPLAFIGAALLGAVLERTLYRPLYRKPHLDQVLFSIGLTFMAVAATDYFMGSTQQIIQLPDCLRGRTEIGSGDWILGMGHYRLFIIAVCAALTVGLQFVLARTRFGSRLRASVDDQRVAAGLGINVNVVFLSTFAFGSGPGGPGRRAGRRGAGAGPDLSAQVHDLFPDRGGRGRHLVDHRAAAGGAAAGHRRRGRQVLHPQARRVHRLQPDDRDPDVAAAGPVRAQRRQAVKSESHCASSSPAQQSLLSGRRWRPWEPLLWLAAFAAPVLLPSHALIVNEIAIVALFAISLDLVLGYTGIVSLGHAAFFGMGAYSAALFAKHVMPDPLVGLAVGIATATVLGALFAR